MMETALSTSKAWIVSKLPAALTAIEAARSCTVPRYKAFTTYADKSKQFPLLELLPSQSQRNYGYEDTPSETDYWRVRTMFLYITATGNTPEDVQLILERYEEAIENIVDADNSFGGAFNRVRLGDTDYSDMVEDQKDKKFALSIRIGIEIRETE